MEDSTKRLVLEMSIGMFLYVAVLGVLGLLIAFSTAKANLRAMRRDADDAAGADEPPISFNDHM